MSTPPHPDRPPALGRRNQVCFGIAALLVALDLWSKAYVFELLETAPLVRDARGHPRYPLAGEWLAFMKNRNYGAAFGRFSGSPHLLVVLRCVAVVLLTWLIARAPRGQGVYLSSLVLIVAGAAGNLYDNVLHGGGLVDWKRSYEFLGMDWAIGPVRDFIDVYFSIWEWHFPTFNVADACITVGAGLLLLSGFGSKPAEATAEQTDAAASAPDEPTPSG